MPIESVDRNVIHRSYYYANCDDFLNASEAEIHDEIVQHSMQFDLTAQQNIAWNEEIRILKQVMRSLVTAKSLLNIPFLVWEEESMS